MLLARLAKLQAASDADMRGDQLGREEAEVQRRKHYGIGEFYRHGGGGGGGGGSGGGRGGDSASTASSLTPPTAHQRAAAASRMLSPRGAARHGAAPQQPCARAAVRALESRGAPTASAAVGVLGGEARAGGRTDLLTPMQRRAQARAADLRAEHRALREATDKEPSFA